MKYNVDTVRESGWYNKKEWLAVRDYVRQRDKMTCVRCGAFGAKKYEVDHIVELTWEIELIRKSGIIFTWKTKQ